MRVWAIGWTRAQLLPPGTERDRLRAEGRWDQLVADLGALVAGADADDGKQISIRAEYLLALGRVQ